MCHHGPHYSSSRMLGQRFLVNATKRGIGLHGALKERVVGVNPHRVSGNFGQSVQLGVLMRK